MRLRGLLWLISAPALFFGCSTCGPGGSAVPFKRGESAEQAAAIVDAGDAPADSRAGLAYPAQTGHIELGGQTLELEQGSVRAALESHGGGKSALLVTQDAEGALALERSERNAKAWTKPVRIAALLPAAREAGAACTAKTVELQALGSTYALVDANLECPAAVTAPLPAPTAAAAPAPAAAAPPLPSAAPAPPAAAPPAPATNPPVQPPPAPAPPTPSPADPPAPEPAAPGLMRPERHLWIVALEPAARVLEHIATEAAERADAAHVEATLQTRDLDGDGRADLLLALDVLVGDQPPTRIEIKLFDRAGGLAAANDEPERTLLALADQAKNERKHNAQRAFELAQRTLAVHATLCRQSATARLRIGGRALDCGASLGAGRAASVLTALLAAQGKLVPALELYQTLEGRAYRLADNDRERARVAVHALVDDHSLAFRSGPLLDFASGPHARRSAIAFIDEGHLLLRGTTGRSYDLASGATEAVGIAAATTILDPTGQLAVSEVVRACDGYHLSIVRAAQAVAGIVTGPSVSEPLLVAEQAPAGAHCPQLSAEQRHDDGGFRVLEWTAQGVLLAREQTLFLLVLDAAASAHEPARAMSASEAVPPLTHPAQLTLDGRYLARLTPLGIAVYDRAHDSTRLFAVPAGDGAIGDIALSPSGRSIAVTRGRQLSIGQPRETSAAAIHSPAPVPTVAPTPPAASNQVAPQ